MMRKCWNANIKARPTFEEIERELTGTSVRTTCPWILLVPSHSLDILNLLLCAEILTDVERGERDPQYEERRARAQGTSEYADMSPNPSM